MQTYAGKKSKIILIGLLIIALSIISGIAGSYIFNKFHSHSRLTVYSINLNKIVNNEKKKIASDEISNPNINPKIIQSRITKFVKYINKDAAKIAGNNGVIIVKQAIAGGNYKDITVLVEQKLKQQGVL